MSNKKKITTAVVAVATAAALLLGGTFAWQSINQTALNEASDVINPGGRLHDDFDGTNKDVYVENFAEDPIFARVRLDEYFEIVMNKGTSAEKTEQIVGTDREDTKTYVTHIFGESNATDDYWKWTTGGSTVYMPTFNMNKDSLVADINGTYEGPDGTDGVTDGDQADRYQDNHVYVDDEPKTDDEIYDADTNDSDEVDTDFDNLQTYVDEENIVTVNETHTAKSTLDATLMSMQEWIDAGSPVGEYWVYDTDGWVYWADAIQPDTATGLLLDGIELAQVMDDSWYYAINVVAQFVTADDLGRGSKTGFYDTENGTAPTPEALELLEKIGVDTTAEVSDLDELLKALEEGGDVLLKNEITSDSANGQIQNEENNYNLLWHNGGNMTAGTLNLSGAKYGLFINNENNWPVDGDGANAATLSDTTVNSDNNVAVYTQAIDAPIVLKDVEINASKIGLYSEYTNIDNPELGTVTLENCTIISQNQSDKYWQNSAVSVAKSSPENGAGHVIINSGYYEGDYAVYVYSSGGTIEINGGYFKGDLGEDSGNLIIRGGTFTVDPSDFIADGYVVVTNEDGTYTVQEKSDNVAPTVSVMENTTVGYKIITVEGVEDGDFPITLKVYTLEADNSEYTEDYFYSTVTLTKTDSGMTYNEERNSNSSYGYGMLIKANLSDDVITMDYDFGVKKDCYLAVTVTDKSGNTGKTQEPLFVRYLSGCFVAGTQVQTVDGPVNIENIKVGDSVYSVDLTTGKKVVSAVEWVQGTRFIDATYTIHAGGETVVVTYEHPFYVVGKEWVAAEELKVGDLLLTGTGEEIKIEKIEYTKLDDPIQVYNFSVSNTHNYLITDSEILVHNIPSKD